MIFTMIIKEQLTAVLKEGNVDLFQKNEFGNTPLHVACNPIYDTNVEIIKLLLKYPLDINSRGLDDVTPLMYAIMKRDITVVNILIENGADVNIPNKYGKTPLMVAVDMFKDDDAIIKLLLENGADPYQKNNYGVSVYKLLEMPRNESIRHLFPLEK
ncbi:ankyrin repeat domain-containing protein [Chryseobacterium formosus]|uniref:Ankyrin repeat domain-containing protein n=1 Tax=Chryseobacterium formosus TaxID=1537363 RepID=A0ABT3XRG2_9FLAO|nr:ankyrin repeat domain-containing protein [Chryseobacterium formosus]MCX8524718.1 ankyrin repeat domain-containing protein [Chryseobacterium formosus]